MTADITGLFVGLQDQVASCDSNTSTQQLIYLAELCLDAAITSSSSIFHSSQFILSDSADSADRIFFDEYAKTLYIRDSDGYRTVGEKQRTFQGEISGFLSGGNTGTLTNRIEEYSFVNDANSTFHGALSNQLELSAGQSSETHGYSSGGSLPSASNVIDKFSFTSPANTTNIGNLTLSRHSSAGCSAATYQVGYTAGGESINNVIDRFSFTSDGNASDVGDLSANKFGATGSSSNTDGYVSGGNNANSTVIDKFSFTKSNTDAINIGALSSAANNGTGLSSILGYGYNVYTDLLNNSVIDKFSFSTDGNASDVGDLTIIVENFAGGTSSTERGYIAGGGDATKINTIQKFSFYTDGTSIDVGDLSNATNKGSSQQY